jgi:UDPglucose--hexose-1-phosphate uridylyltransferase
MPELRKDPVLGRWVIVASERAKRPNEFKAHHAPAREGACPFCEGNEAKTPPEVLAYRNDGTAPDGPGWRVRVVPNKYPALTSEGNLDEGDFGIYDRMNGIGAHEVVIETPAHVRSLSALDEARAGEVILAYKERLASFRGDHRMVCAMVFKNVGVEAGASLEHTHSQIIVTPVVPRTVRQEMDGSRGYFDHRGRCLFCDMVRQETADGERVVVESEGFLAFCPFASRFPYETWIVPRRHASHFERITDAESADLAGVLRTTVLKLEAVLDEPPYNYMFHSTPLSMRRLAYYHWHVELMPRLTQIAGFEWGTGFYINPAPPEEAARAMREANV